MAPESKGDSRLQYLGSDVDHQEVLPMVQRLPRLLFSLFVLACFSTIASAQIGVGLLTYDSITASDNEFDVTNLTGSSAFPSFGFPITTPLTFTITSLVVNFTSGPSLTLGASDFTTDAAGDE